MRAVSGGRDGGGRRWGSAATDYVAAFSVTDLNGPPRVPPPTGSTSCPRGQDPRSELGWAVGAAANASRCAVALLLCHKCYSWAAARSAGRGRGDPTRRRRRCEGRTLGSGSGSSGVKKQKTRASEREKYHGYPRHINTVILILDTMHVTTIHDHHEVGPWPHVCLWLTAFGLSHVSECCYDYDSLYSCYSWGAGRQQPSVLKEFYCRVALGACCCC